MEIIKLDYISGGVAKKINKILSARGIPSEDKMVVATPTGESKVGGIILPGTADESRPKKGVIVQVGRLSEAYEKQSDLFQVGFIVTYGLYAGKEINFDYEEFPQELKDTLNNTKFTILSLNEVAYIESNLK